MKKCSFLLSGMMFCLFLWIGRISPVFAQEATLEFEGRYWFPDLDSNVKVVQSGVGSTINVPSDLGVGNENFPEGRLIWHTTENSRLRLTYTRATYEGDKTLTRTVQFDGQTYTSGTRVTSEFELHYFSAGWIWQFLHFMDDKVQLGPMIEGKGIFADISLSSPTQSEREKMWGGLPTVGAALDIAPFKQVKLYGEASGFWVGPLGNFFDAEVGIQVTPVKYVTLLGGYRFVDIEAEDDPDFVEVELSGFFVGGRLRF